MTDSPSARAGRQLLESLERSGVTHLARPVESVVPQPKDSEMPIAGGDDPPGGAGGLEEMARSVAACQRCQELAETRTQTVFGVGDPDAKILFVGEAPGADEDRLGEPFVGRAGKLLDKIITACGLQREQIYICNILKCRPPNNRDPQPDEIEKCEPYLKCQIAMIQPLVICTLGRFAASYGVVLCSGSLFPMLCDYCVARSQLELHKPHEI